jgi:hypothetical protein
VIAAQHFNPSIAKQIWLVDNYIVHREEFKDDQEGVVFTDMFVQVPTRDFHLLIVPDNCQFTIPPHVERQQELILDRVGRIVSTLPHTPYKAIGLNFIWHLTPPRGTIAEASRKLFFSPNNLLHRLFDAPDARFGCYSSKESLGFRLKLDVKPMAVLSAENGKEKEAIQYAFNYHCDLTGSRNAVEEITSILGRWNEARDEAEEIVKTTVGDL